MGPRTKDGGELTHLKLLDHVLLVPDHLRNLRLGDVAQLEVGELLVERDAVEGVKLAVNKQSLKKSKAESALEQPRQRRAKGRGTNLSSPPGRRLSAFGPRVRCWRVRLPVDRLPTIRRKAG